MGNNTLRIVSWNCHYGFDGEKPNVIKEFNADILVIPECREMDMEESGYDKEHRNWWGDHKEAKDKFENINKEKDLGVGVFWKDGITVTRLDKWDKSLSQNCDFRYLIPYTIEGDFKTFTLIAVWTKDRYKLDKNDQLKYTQKLIAAIDHYKSIGLLDDQVVLIGDFNTYAKDSNDNLKKLEEKLKPLINCTENSSFHTRKTYYDARYGYGIDDFCFISGNMKNNSKKIEVDIPNDWDNNNNWKGSDQLSHQSRFYLLTLFFPHFSPSKNIFTLSLYDRVA